jgi:hypothetical protein
MRKGAIGHTADGMNRSNTGSAWEVLEVADWGCDQNIEFDGENKYLVMKAVKQRDLD